MVEDQQGRNEKDDTQLTTGKQVTGAGQCRAL